MNKLILNNLSRRKFIKIVGLSLLGSTGYGTYTYLNKKIVKTKWNGYILNAPAKLEIHSYSEKENFAAIEKVNKLALSYDNIFNLQNKNSEIVKLNNKKIINTASKEMLVVIKKAQLISNKTNGAFDTTGQPLWSFYHSHFILENNTVPPTIEKINDIKKSINWKNVEINTKSISLINNASITLNGIAQGWITDQIVKTL